jgi:hypothetical protein
VASSNKRFLTDEMSSKRAASATSAVQNRKPVGLEFVVRGRLGAKRGPCSERPKELCMTNC